MSVHWLYVYDQLNIVRGLLLYWKIRRLRRFVFKLEKCHKYQKNYTCMILFNLFLFSNSILIINGIQSVVEKEMLKIAQGLDFQQLKLFGKRFFFLSQVKRDH